MTGPNKISALSLFALVAAAIVATVIGAAITMVYRVSVPLEFSVVFYTDISC